MYFYIMIQLKEYNNNKFASAKDVYDFLEVKRRFSEWIKPSIKNASLKEGIDFVTYKLQSTGGRPIIDFLLTERSAIRIVLQSRMPKSIELENIIVKAFKEKQTGILLNADQVAALTDMVKAMTLISVQKESENKHYAFFNQPKKWWDYRANLLGYSTDSLKKEMIEINKRYKSQRQALVNLRPSELIRTGVIDLLIALGKGEEYALNVANFAQIIAEKNGYDKQIWNDTKPNPLGLNQENVTERKKLI